MNARSDDDELAEARAAVHAHRPDVVRRLRERGLGPELLEHLLPGWGRLDADGDRDAR